MSRPLPFILGAWLLLSACTTLPRAPTTLQEDAEFRSEVMPTPPGMDPTPPEPFHLRSGDVLALHVISVTPIDVPRIDVDDTGVLYLPLAGAVQVGGLTLDAAEAKIQDALRRFDKYGVASLSIVQPAGHQASVLGAVERPGVYPVAGQMHVSDLLARAGGARTSISERSPELIEYGDLEASRLVRGGVVLPISLSEAMLGNPRHDVPIQSGDQLYIPPLHGDAVAIYGDAREPRSMPWHKGVRLSDALAYATGLTTNADYADIRIIRGPLSRPHVYRASITDFIAGRATDVELARGDVVFVTSHWYYTTTDVLQRVIPLLTVGGAAAVLPTFYQSLKR